MAEISVIVPVYKAEAFLRKCTDSILNQTFTDLELLLVEDGSPDQSGALCDQIAAEDPRVRVFHKPNGGVSSARNVGLDEAKGQYIAFLDSDDLWRPEKIELQLKFMVKNKYVFTYHEYTEMTEDGLDNGVYVSGIRKVNAFNMYACCWPGCLAVMYDAEKIGLIQINDIKKNNDTAMWLKVVQKAPCYLLKQNLAFYRRRANSITPKPLWQRIWAHYPLFRIAEEMNPVVATFWTLMNVFGNGIKKIFYVKKVSTYRVDDRLKDKVF